MQRGSIGGLLVTLAALTGCAAAAPRETRRTISVSVSTPPPERAPEVATPARRAFVSVVIATDGPVSIFPTGRRALIAHGAALWGYAIANAAPVHDPSVGEGLPQEGGAFPENVGGVWPDVVMSHGSGKLFAHYGGAEPVLFARRDGRFVASKIAPPEVPRDVATASGVVFAFVPEPGHFQDSAEAVTGHPSCTGKSLRHQPLLVVRGNTKSAPLRAPASFFLQSLATDGAGNGWAVGADACVPGAFIAPLGSSPLRLERVPSSDACADRTSGEGVPFTHARIFPAAGGGLFVLLVNRRGISEEEERERTGACAEPPRVLSRSPTGTWSAPRVLPTEYGDVAYVDPAGTVWAMTARATVMRIPERGMPEELALDESCERPADPRNPHGKRLSIDRREGASAISRLVVPFPDQPWIVVRYQGGEAGLCTAKFGYD